VPTRSARAQIVVGKVVTVVDPGSAKAVLAALAREGMATGDVRRIVLTHGDGDHWTGAAALQDATGAEIVAHADERGYLEGRAVPPFSLVKRGFIVMSRFVRRPTIARWLADGEEIDDMHVIHTPGHTPGHIVLVAGDALIAGDALRTGDEFREVPTVMTSDLVRSRASIGKLGELDVRRAFSGHGPPSDDAAAKLRALAARTAS